MDNIYVSTSCLGFERKSTEVLDIYKKAGIKNVELGSSHIYEQGIEDYLANSDFNFIVHNCFPPPKQKIIMNLASPDKKILDLSKDQVKKGIDLCFKMDIPLYSFHSGFRIDPEVLTIEKGLKRNNITDYKSAFNVFVDSVKEILKYARNKNVRIAIEPNIVSELNLVNGKNELLLMCEYREFENLFKKVNSPDLGILLDLGHLKVTANSLSFNRDEFIEQIKDKVFEIHLHDNDSKKDIHFPVTEKSWALDILKKFKDIPVCLESQYNSIGDLIKNYSLIYNSLVNNK